MIYSIGASSK
jgi:hypothetical protein